MKDCFNCSNFEPTGKVTTGSGKKSKSKDVISYCKVYKKSIAEIPFCDSFKPKEK